MPPADSPPHSPKHAPLTLAVVGAALVIAAVARSGIHGLQSGLAIGGMICLGIAATALAQKLFASHKLPKTEVLRLAQSHGGILSLSEIATALNIDPDLAAKTLVALSKSGLAQQRWQEFRKNIWEFPDYMKLPITQSLDLAKQNGGRLSLSDLLASGHSPDTAQQTLDTLTQTGLAHQDPTTHSLILTAQ